MHRGLVAIVLGLLVFVLAGCESTGGTIGGLLPAPKLYQGKVEGNRYVAMDGSFSVTLPHEVDSYQYKYMSVKERYTNVGAYVSFGPAATDQSIFRVDLGKKISPESRTLKLQDLAPQIVASYRKQLEEGYSAPMDEVSQGTATVRQALALTWQYRQHIPSRSTLQGRTVETIFQHTAYAIESADAAVVLWVQIEEKCSFCRERAAAFVNSFQFGK